MRSDVLLLRDLAPLSRGGAGYLVLRRASYGLPWDYGAGW